MGADIDIIFGREKSECNLTLSCLYLSCRSQDNPPTQALCPLAAGSFAPKMGADIDIIFGREKSECNLYSMFLVSCFFFGGNGGSPVFTAGIGFWMPCWKRK